MMKYMVWIFLMLFVMNSFGQEREESAQSADEFNICSFLTDIGLVYKYSNVETICSLRDLGNLTEKKCLEYLNAKSIATEFNNVEELHNFLRPYRSGDMTHLIPEAFLPSWPSFIEAMGIRCSGNLQGTSAEEIENEVLNIVKCISDDITERKKEYNCTD